MRSEMIGDAHDPYGAIRGLGITALRKSRCQTLITWGERANFKAPLRRADQRLAFPGEQQPGSTVDMVAAAARPAGGIARPPRASRPRPVPHPLFLLFYQVEIRHRQLLQ
jgi:hypothetical protein